MKLNKRAFTLLELIIVVVIIGILAGVVLPYAQRYIEDARISQCKQVLNEISNAITRYETDQRRPYIETDISWLVGPYLQKAMADPWGSPFEIDNDRSAVISYGPDRKPATGDEIVEYFRPPLAISRAYWVDSNNNLRPDDNDYLILKFTRPIKTATESVDLTDFDFSSDSPDAIATDTVQLTNHRMTMSFQFTYDPSDTPFQAGNDYINVVENSNIVDFDDSPCRSQQTIIRTQ